MQPESVPEISKQIIAKICYMHCKWWRRTPKILPKLILLVENTNRRFCKKRNPLAFILSFVLTFFTEASTCANTIYFPICFDCF
jgi:hypothetical protein